MQVFNNFTSSLEVHEYCNDAIQITVVNVSIKANNDADAMIIISQLMRALNQSDMFIEGDKMHENI